MPTIPTHPATAPPSLKPRMIGKTPNRSRRHEQFAR